MSGRNISLSENCSIGEQEADQKYEYIKALNRDLVNEVVMLRKAKSQMQTENDFLLRKNMDADIRNNECMQILLNIDKRSKVCLNKIVECSTELTEIMGLAKKMMNNNRKSSETPVSSKSNLNSFKQVVTPHAVNGHIIHTPTIRLARYNEPRLEEQNGSIGEEGQISYNDNYSNEGMNEEDPEKETVEQCTESEIMNDSETDEPEEEPRNLQTIAEESPNQSITEDQETSVLTGRCQEVETYSNQSMNKNLRINKRRGVGALGDCVPDDPSLRMTTNETPNGSDVYPDPQSKVSERFSIAKTETPKRSSIAKRKSLGSPIPPKISRRIGSSLQPEGARSSGSPDMSGSSATHVDSWCFVTSLKDPSRNILQEEFSTDTLRKTSEGSICYPKVFSRPSASSIQCSHVRETEGELNGTTLKTPGLALSILPDLANESSINSYIDKNSIHSTPLCRKSRSSLKTRKKSPGTKITTRRKKMQTPKSSFPAKELVVKIERLDPQDLIRFNKSSVSYTKKSQGGGSIAEIGRTPVKEIKIENATPPIAARERPTRAAKPSRPLVEPSLHTKLRRDF